MSRYKNSFLIFLNILFITTSSAFAQEIATVFSTEGKVEINRSATTTWSGLTKDLTINGGDTVRTGSAGKVAIIFNDGGLVRLNENSTMQFKPPAQDKQNDLALRTGNAFFFSREPKKFPKIETPSVSAAVRGTEFVIEATSTETKVSVLDGSVYCSNAHGEVAISGGEFSTTKKGKAPEKGIILNPLDAVQWAIHIPALEDKTAKGIPQKAPVKAQLVEISKLLSKGDLTNAENLLNKTITNYKKSSQRESDTLAYLHAYSSIIALSRNNMAKANEDAQIAIESSPDNTYALLANTYVAQSKFDLAQAKTYVEKLVRLDPTNTIAIAKLAELHLSLGDINGARKLIANSAEAGESSSLMQTVSGFISLIDHQPKEAQTKFENAILLDINAALPILGRGLSKINQGYLDQGRQDLEVAAAMEPTVAIYRSYLGKAYFEENRENLSLNEYSRAIALDPNDPTPHLYRAYSHLSQNNVVAALNDVEDSILKNNNRAVYRSRLYLDQDSAVRSAGLAEVFNSLGFNKVAQIEAIKSIQQDYSNYSAHKLLGESYNTIQTADAFLSQRAISSLLSPLSFNIYSNPGNDVSVNEYNALFDRPGQEIDLRFKGSTFGDLAVPAAFLSGRTEKFGYLLGVESANGKGSKDGDYLRDHRFRAAGQYQISATDRVIGEARYQSTHIEDDESFLDEVILEEHEFNLGYHRTLGPGSGFLAQISYRDVRGNLGTFSDRPIELDIISAGELFSTETLLFLRDSAREDVRDTRLSAQYYKKGELVSLVSGAEYYNSRPHRRETSTILDDDFDIYAGLDRNFPSFNDTVLGSGSVYLYPTVHLSEKVDLNLGISYVDIELEDRLITPYTNTTRDASEWNPKIGATVYLTSDLTWRSAYFEGLRKSAFEDNGSIEPTLVGGFNQFYTDFPGAETRNYGTGLDYKMAKKTYVGIEGLRRKVTNESNTTTSTVVLDFDTMTESNTTRLRDIFDEEYDQDYVSAYLYQIISKRVVGSVDYNWYRSQIDDPDTAQDIKLHRTRFALRYFDPSGWFTFATATWREQDRQGGFFIDDGNSNFWLADFGIGYRIPERRGSITFKINNIFDKNFDYDQSAGFEEFVPSDLAGEINLVLNF